MPGKTAEITDMLTPDRTACGITEQWINMDMLRTPAKGTWREIREYVFATDTSHTSNSTTPWKNRTTIPKLCQIRDNLYSNYSLTTFPQRKSIEWQADETDSNSVAKRDAIVNYTTWAMEQPSFKHELDKIILDYIDYGNAFATVEWTDDRVDLPGRSQVGYIGPSVRRINPLDIVFNPTAENFYKTPKIVRSIVSLGDIKEYLERQTTDHNREEYEELWKYLKDIRHNAHQFEGDYTERDTMYQVDGFTSFREYLKSSYVEVLTFYGDLYDVDSQELLKNYVITVVDRHKLIGKKPNPSFFGYPPIFHVGWRKRQDNLWAMGPLDNLIGLQYRLDHVENMKADIFDLTTYPVQKIKGFVEDYTWQPGEKIYVSEEGDVDMVVPDVNALNANFEIQALKGEMEEMAGAPKEAMGFRTPGEKTKYEVQRLENAASRVFQNKIRQFEEQMIEPLLNAMLELARRNLQGVNSIRVFSDEFKIATFQSLTAEDITGIGRIKPVAARHFAEEAELVQNLTSLASSPLWAVVQPHFSGIKLAKFFERSFKIQDLEMVTPYVALAEQADAQRRVQVLQEQLAAEATTATGIGEDYDLDQMGNPMMTPPDEQSSMMDQMAQAQQAPIQSGPPQPGMM